MKSVSIRFYEELNDFLPSHQRKMVICHTCFGSPSIKDIIESMGVPHTEVDLILANSVPVDFSYRPFEEDYISVYPVFESIDISKVNLLRKEPLRVPKFIADVHLGRLARYLRLLGFDTCYRNDLEDDEIVDISVAEKRIVLTRDLQLLKNSRVTHGYYIRNKKPALQAREVMQRFDLADKVQPFHRCTECNGTIEQTAKKDVIHLLPPRTRDFYEDFYQCTDCKKVYWQGSHFKDMSAWIEKTIQEARRRSNDI